MRNLLQLHAHHRPSGQPGGRFVSLDENEPHITYIASASHVAVLNGSEAAETHGFFDDAATAAVRIVGLQHLSLNNELCVATSAGDVVLLNLQTHGRESVGFCGGGIRRMAWSPDQEVVAFVSDDAVLIVMDTAFVTVAECVLSASGFGDGAFVNVGWGAKETQFHGTEGKAARYRSADQPAAATTNATASTADSVDIVWRGDSEFFAVSFATPSATGGGGSRVFKVFDKAGTLQFTSEPSVGLGAAISWRPSGTWLVIPQQLANKYVVALFEKNGLKHREIVLPFGVQHEQVERLQWSSDSDVLAIQTIRTETPPAGKWTSRIYLYTMCNYHWYVKQTLEFRAAVSSIVWNTEPMHGKRLHVLTADGDYSVYCWVQDVNVSRSLRADDAAVVSVIDGPKVLLTGCRAAVVPPPMCSLEVVHTDANVNSVDWLRFAKDNDDDNGVNRFLTVDTNNVVRTFACQTNGVGRLESVRAVGVFQCEPNRFPLEHRHWLYLTSDTIVYATADIANETLYLGRLIDGQVKRLASQKLIGTIDRLDAISADVVAVVTSAGLFRIALDVSFGNADIALPLYTYPDRVEHLCVTEGGQHVFALRPKHWLYHNGRSIAAGVTSMHLTEQYLLFTTLDTLRFVRLADGAIVGDRRIERGGRLVVSVPHDSRTVLQMPRGNLETIQPRVLSLCIIGAQLDRGDYRRAFDAMRKQRINLNLLIDHDACGFIDRVEAFVRSVDNAQWLSLFLYELEDVEVTRTMYESNYPARIGAAQGQTYGGDGDKIDEVCRRVREAIETLGLSGPLLLPILTSYVKQKRLEQALQIIWTLRQQEEERVVATDAIVTDCSADEALKYLLLLVDVNELYNVALGMYDFGLVRYVATKSQKDPKEYLPQLAELEQIADIAYRQYRIDVQLKRYERALDHIVACGAERADECVELVRKHGLYREALRRFEQRETADAADRSVCDRVVRAFAEDLRERGKFRDACLMYERCGDYAQAVLSARHILDWQKCIALAKRLGQTEVEIAQLVGSLIPSLVENGQGLDAAQLVLKYQANVVLAVKILCDSRLYVQALFEARMSDDTLIESLVRPHLSAYADTLVSVLEADQAQFVEYQQRLATIRSERLAAATRMANGDDAHYDGAGDPDMDAFSDTSSMRSSTLSSRGSASSRGTGKTHRSSKNRRKHERKLLSLKPGNPFEDIALIDALHGLANKAYDQQAGVRALGKALIDQQLDAHGRRVQQALRMLLRRVDGALAEIWIPEMVVSGECVALVDEGRLDYALAQQQQHYAMIKPHQRYKPLLKAIDWEFDVLQ